MRWPRRFSAKLMRSIEADDRAGMVAQARLIEAYERRLRERFHVPADLLISASENVAA